MLSSVITKIPRLHFSHTPKITAQLYTEKMWLTKQITFLKIAWVFQFFIMRHIFYVICLQLPSHFPSILRLQLHRWIVQDEISSWGEVEHFPHALCRWAVPEFTEMARISRLPLHNSFSRGKERAGFRCISLGWELCVGQSIAHFAVQQSLPLKFRKSMFTLSLDAILTTVSQKFTMFGLDTLNPWKTLWLMME